LNKSQSIHVATERRQLTIPINNNKQINEKEILLLKGTASETFSIENAEKEVINSIYNFLLPKLDNRIFKEQ